MRMLTFTAKVNGHNILVQERIPGVALAVAWQYLSQAQKASFKRQARIILRRLQNLKLSPSDKYRTYIAPDPEPIRHRGIQEMERDIIFAAGNDDSGLGFMHNDFTPDNSIVNKDTIVGLVDWEMAGYFGWKTAGAVHVEIRTPKRELQERQTARRDAQRHFLLE
ncbi:MAG: hypothetical protein Q9227_001687 [Pyrenula ochraceoflavens]